MFNRLLLAITLIMLVSSSMMLSGIKAFTLVRDTKHLTVDGNKVEVYVVPEIPVDLIPVWILVHAEGYQEGQLQLKVRDLKHIHRSGGSLVLQDL